ncbi:hypothetical protein EV662_101559 [Rhodovulum marinum]|uniref:Uncharacterized protein n=2 Tax=Rhodovulum marinum TaxID=320662 RepID=A0A4R2QC36_9RHOB|nr:hypothetical protein EV662_101559 [Rhodovulum marinum]
MAMLGVSGCGVDGPPERPGGTQVSVGGTVEIGVSGGGPR